MAGRRDARSVAFHGRLLDNSEMARMFFNEFGQFCNFRNRNDSIFVCATSTAATGLMNLYKAKQEINKKIIFFKILMKNIFHKFKRTLNFKIND